MVDMNWTDDAEMRLLHLLRDLARCETAAERTALTDELKELTGLDLGAQLPKWLGWYLEDHLGMRNVLGILAGREALDTIDNPAGLLAEENVFERAEYNWCAIERIRNKDDMQKLRHLYSDLESPIQTGFEGSFSFRRLTGLDSAELEYFSGKTISESIFDDNVQLRHLRILKDYGKMMMMPLFPSATQRSGAVIYAAAISQALVKFDTKITSLSYQELGESLPGLIERPYVVECFARVFRNALEKCQ